jgi:hypothetical protein
MHLVVTMAVGSVDKKEIDLVLKKAVDLDVRMAAMSVGELDYALAVMKV